MAAAVPVLQFLEPVADDEEEPLDKPLTFVKRYCNYWTRQLDAAQRDDPDAQLRIATGHGLGAEPEQDEDAEDAWLPGGAQTDLWKKELSTWVLLFRLAFYRRTRRPPAEGVRVRDGVRTVPKNPSSAFARLCAAHEHDAALNELHIVKQWLEDAASAGTPAPEPSEFYYRATFQLLRGGATGGDLVTALDPDAAARQGRQWAPPDRLAMGLLFQGVWACLRAGLIAEAVQSCRQAQHAWLAACLVGSYRDELSLGLGSDEPSSADGAGAPSGADRALLASTAYRLACEKTLTAHERAVFAALAGDMANATGVCATWHDMLWVYCNAAYRQRAAHWMYPPALGGTAETDEPVDDALRQLPQPPPPRYSSISALLAALQRHESAAIAHSARAPFHLLQACIVTDRIPALLSDICAALQRTGNGAPAEPADDGASIADHAAGLASSALQQFRHPFYMRVLAHLVLFLQQSDPGLVTASVAGFILQTHIQQLVRAGGEPEHVAALVARLPDAAESEALFARLLLVGRDVFGAEEPDWAALDASRAQMLALGARHGLFVAKVIRQAVAQSLGPAGDAFTPAAAGWLLDLSDTAVTVVSERHWRAIAALGYYDLTVETESERAPALNALVRRFLLRGEIKAAQCALQRSAGAPGRGDSEVQQLAAVVDTWVLLQTWVQAAAAPASSGRAAGLRAAAEAALGAARALLEGRWLEALSACDEAPEAGELAALRRLYVPELVHAAFAILRRTCSAFPEVAAEIPAWVRFVASDDYGIYTLIVRERRMASLVEMITASMVDNVDLAASALLLPRVSSVSTVSSLPELSEVSSISEMA